jgi:MoxR-like ATPase
VAGSKSVREINVHPEVTFIATANVGSEYTGTQSMDRALVNRFFPIELNYIPSNQEEKVLMHRTQITSDQAKTIVKIANTVRSLAEKQEISTSVSIRETLYVAELVKDGWNVGSSITKIFAPLYEGSKSTGERSIIYKTIASY